MPTENKLLTHKELLDNCNRRRKRGLPVVHFPNVIGRLRGRHVFLIGNSPSLGLLPEGWADTLSDERLFTVAINRAIMWMRPRFWWVGDQETISTKNYRVYHESEPGSGVVPLSYDESFDGVRVWWEGVAAVTKRSNFIPWNWGFFLYYCQTADLENLHRWPESDLFALQVFMGIMLAKRVVLVGVDHAEVRGQTHYELTCERDKAKQEQNKNMRFGHESPQYCYVRDGLNKMACHARNAGHEIYTASPAEDTVVREVFPYIDFNQCVKEALANHDKLGPDDLKDLRDHKAILDWTPREEV